MAIPFRDLRSEEDLGLAGYLRFVPEAEGRGLRGALFLVNARGEPVDFAFSRVDVPASFLWRAGEAKRHAVAALTSALFQASPKNPNILLALADEVNTHLFTEDILVDIPLCRVANAEDIPHAVTESVETLSVTAHLFCVAQPPTEDSLARKLLACLQARQILTEPFERAARGLEEAFAGDP